jgi:hypothetical protein
MCCENEHPRGGCAEASRDSVVGHARDAHWRLHGAGGTRLANRGRPGAPQSKLHSTNMVAGAPRAVDNGLNGRLDRFLAGGRC